MVAQIELATAPPHVTAASSDADIVESAIFILIWSGNQI